MAQAVPAKPTRPAASGIRALTPKGCLLIVLAAWAVWILIDLWRLGVFDGSMALSGAVFEMPSVGLPLVVAVGITALTIHVTAQNRRRRAFPDEPWMWEKRWNRSGARPVAFEKLARPLGFAAAAAVASSMAVVALLETPGDSLLQVLTALVCAVALGAWVFAVNRAARVLRFRHTWFEYDSFPFFLGGKLSGALVGIEPAAGADTMTATLRLVQERWSGSGSGSRSGRTRIRSVVQEEARQYRREDIVERAILWRGRKGKPTYGLRPSLSVAFDLPASAKQTALEVEPVFRWELQVTARRTGLDFDVTFLVPVYSAPHPVREGTRSATG